MVHWGFRVVVLILGLCILAPVAGAEDFSVLHLNVWSGLRGGGFFTVPAYEERAAREFRAGLIADGLEALDPDLITLVEANPLPAYSNRLSERLQYDAHHQVIQAGVRIGVVGLPANLRMGHVVLADPALGLESLGNRTLSGGGAGNLFSWNISETSVVVGAKVTIAGRSLFLFTLQLHESVQAYEADLVALATAYSREELSSAEYVAAVRDGVEGRERRMTEIERAIVYINDLAGQDPVILTGTFGARPDSRVIELLTAAGFRDSYAEGGAGPGYTRDAAQNTNLQRFQTGEDRLRVDYIMYRGEGLRVLRSELAFDEATFGVHASDHFGVHSFFRIEALE